MAENYYPWTPSPILPPCYGIFGHTSVECQLGHQVASPSQTSGILPSQPKANPKVQLNDVILRYCKQLEDPVVETKTNEVEVESEKPQRFDEFKLDEQVRKFVEIIQAKLPSKLKDPKSFSIPCVIGSEIIERVMCDLGENNLGTARAHTGMAVPDHAKPNQAKLQELGTAVPDPKVAFTTLCLSTFKRVMACIIWGRIELGNTRTDELFTLWAMLNNHPINTCFSLLDYLSQVGNRSDGRGEIVVHEEHIIGEEEGAHLHQEEEHHDHETEGNNDNERWTWIQTEVERISTEQQRQGVELSGLRNDSLRGNPYPKRITKCFGT
ncbi:hypothetical protein MTR_6g452660 [Medicago truncatula]|uniref:Uncharacterized protein n=1 Tax=Medicago truncatula TaxID=3880 RepID=A0A072UB70_MEDTR|nr:hypothetical protein MTR_6g452660 [Medicago truncatula]